jgi:hypothetical protein
MSPSAGGTARNYPQRTPAKISSYVCGCWSQLGRFGAGSRTADGQPQYVHVRCDGRGSGGTRMGFDLCEPATMGHRPPVLSHTQRRDRAWGESPTLWPSMKPLGTWGDLDHPLTAPGYPSRPIVVVGLAAVGSIDDPYEPERRWTHVCKIIRLKSLF